MTQGTGNLTSRYGARVFIVFSGIYFNPLSTRRISYKNWQKVQIKKNYIFFGLKLSQFTIRIPNEAINIRLNLLNGGKNTIRCSVKTHRSAV